MTGRLEGKVAFITGVARGQGRSHALRLAEEGADIIGIDICESIATAPYDMASVADLDETRAGVEALGRKAHLVQADVRDFDQVNAALADGVAAMGRLDIIVANAGITSQAPLHEMTEDQWQDMIGVNLTGVWHTAKASVPHLLKQDEGGSIVLIASTCATKAYEQIGHYVAAKHGVIGLMKTMALELSRHSIRVNCVSPTQVDTDMIMNEPTFRIFSPELENPTREDFAIASQNTNYLPVPWIEPSDVSAVVAFLASDHARYVTGVNLPVDAGCLLK